MGKTQTTQENTLDYEKQVQAILNPKVIKRYVGVVFGFSMMILLALLFLFVEEMGMAIQAKNLRTIPLAIASMLVMLNMFLLIRQVKRQKPLLVRMCANQLKLDLLGIEKFKKHQLRELQKLRRPTNSTVCRLNYSGIMPSHNTFCEN